MRGPGGRVVGTRITRAGRTTIAVVALGIAFVLGAVVLRTATTSLPGPIDLAAVPDADAARGDDVGFRLIDGARATGFGTGGGGADDPAGERVGGDPATSPAEAPGSEPLGAEPATGDGAPAPGGAATTTRPSGPAATPSAPPVIGTPTTPSPTVVLPPALTGPLPPTPTVTVPAVTLPPVTIPGVDPTPPPTITVPVVTVPAVTVPTTLPPLPISPFGA